MDSPNHDAAASRKGPAPEKLGHNGASSERGAPVAGNRSPSVHAGSDSRSVEAASVAAKSVMQAGEASGENGPKSKRRRRRRRKKRGGQMSGDANATTMTPMANAHHNADTQPTRPRPYPKPNLAQRRTNDTYAALDLGTNNCRLLVAVPTRQGQFRVVDAFSRIVRLGEGLGATGKLSDGAMDRAVGALKSCGDKLEKRPVKRMRLIATEACRSADNGRAFLDRVRDETGLDLEIVDRKTEAHLAVSGCASLVERNTDGMVLFDIGGGSSEIALMDLARKKGKLTDRIVAWTSLPIGVVTLAEKFGGEHVTPDIFAKMKTHCAQLLDGFAQSHRLDHYLGSRNFALLGTSGTVTTLAGIHLGLQRYDRRKVDGLWMTSDEVTSINEQLVGWSFEERVANPCIGADRADLVLAGCAILEAIRERWPAERLRVADRGLREGLLTEMMYADGVWRKRGRYRGKKVWPKTQGKQEQSH